MSGLFESLKAEGLVSLSAAARSIGVHPASLSRWCRRGAKGRAGARVTLEHLKLPGRIVTSEAAVGRFLAAIAGEPDAPAFTRTPAKRRKAAEDAGHALAAQWGI